MNSVPCAHKNLKDPHRICPIFVFSVARSGSTLLQRILASHEKIATVSEPWLLLPLLYSIKPDGAVTEYGHNKCYTALMDFQSHLPGGRITYLEAVQDFAIRLYGEAASSKSEYFVDKTPRYCLVVEQIIETFPDAKFIFLWRNPLAVIASISRSLGGGDFNMVRYRQELYTGMKQLLRAYQDHKEKVIALRFEDFVSQPEMILTDLYRYLELPYDESAQTRFADVELNGRHGDHIGTNLYKELSSEPLAKWRGFFCNPLRKRVAASYLEWLGRDRLALMGYNFDALKRELDQEPLGIQCLLSDSFILAKQLSGAALQSKLIRRSLARRSGGDPDVIFD